MPSVTATKPLGYILDSDTTTPEDTPGPVSLTYPTKALKSALAALAPHVPSKTSISVLGCVLLSPESLSATDMQTWAEYSIAGEGTGSLLIGHKILKDAVASVKTPTVQITETDDGKARVGYSTVYTLPLADFPTRPDFAPDSSLTSPDMLEALSRVVPAVSTDETRPVLTGVLVTPDHIVATDSYRMHVAPYTANTPLTTSVLLPGSTIRGLVKAKVSGPVTLETHWDTIERESGEAWEYQRDDETGESHYVRTAPHNQTVLTLTPRYRLSVGSLSLITSSPVDGRYPNWRQLTPESLDSTMLTDRTELLEAVNAARKFIGRTKAPVCLSYNGNGHVDVTAETMDVGSFAAEVGCVTEDWTFTIGFCPAFLADALTHMADDTATIKATTPRRPAVIEGAHGFALVMPVRLND